MNTLAGTSGIQSSPLNVCVCKHLAIIDRYWDAINISMMLLCCIWSTLYLMTMHMYINGTFLRAEAVFKCLIWCAFNQELAYIVMLVVQHRKA